MDKGVTIIICDYDAHAAAAAGEIGRDAGITERMMMPRWKTMGKLMCSGTAAATGTAHEFHETCQSVAFHFMSELIFRY